MESRSERQVAFVGESVGWSLSSRSVDLFGQRTLASGSLAGLGRDRRTLRLDALLKAVELVPVLLVFHLQGPAQQDLSLKAEAENLGGAICTTGGGAILAGEGVGSPFEAASVVSRVKLSMASASGHPCEREVGGCIHRCARPSSYTCPRYPCPCLSLASGPPFSRIASQSPPIGHMVESEVLVQRGEFLTVFVRFPCGIPK